MKKLLSPHENALYFVTVTQTSILFALAIILKQFFVLDVQKGIAAIITLFIGVVFFMINLIRYKRINLSSNIPSNRIPIGIIYLIPFFLVIGVPILIAIIKKVNSL